MTGSDKMYRKIWNREVKKLILLLSAVFLLCFVVGNIFQIGLYHKMRAENNQRFMTFFGNVKELYPDIREEEWIQLLNGRGNEERGQEILEYYGIFADSDTFIAQEKRLRQGLVLLI